MNRQHNTVNLTRATCVLAALLALAASIAAAAPTDNLLPNASFEQLDPATVMPKGWTNWATPNQAVFTLAAARTGVACAVLTDDDGVMSQGLRSPRVPVQPGKTYRASVWLKIERAQQAGFAIYLEYWQGPNRVADRSVYLTRAPNWTPLTVAYPAPEGATEATILLYSSSATIGRAYFDDASLTTS